MILIRCDICGSTTPAEVSFDHRTITTGPRWRLSRHTANDVRDLCDLCVKDESRKEAKR